MLKDDNPDIKSYLGYGDIVVRLEGSVKNITTVLLRNNLSLNQNRGFVQLDYAYPLREKSSAYYLHFQGLLGYGETLIDYNHYQKAIGIGLSFRD